MTDDIGLMKSRGPYHSFASLFTTGYSPVPVIFSDPPSELGGKIETWRQHRVYKDCFVPVIGGLLSRTYFFCNHCRRWKKMNTSKQHIDRHFQTATHSDAIFEAEHKISRDFAERIQRSLVLFIIQNGLPFSLGDDEQLHKITTALPNHLVIRDTAISMAAEVGAIMKSMLAKAEYVTISCDEWSDRLMARYLGISAHSMVDKFPRVFTISHSFLATTEDERDHIPASQVAGMIYEVMKEYGVEKNSLLVVTGRAKVMRAAVECLNERRIGEGLPPLQWANCICHALNSIMGKFVTLLQNRFRDITEFQKKLSETFHSFLRRKNSSVTRIPAYVAVRWYSLFEMLNAMLELKHLIIEFCILQEWPQLPVELWKRMEDFRDFPFVVKNATMASRRRCPRFATHLLVLYVLNGLF